jgi:OmpA-OmpF porin, OOP family
MKKNILIALLAAATFAPAMAGETYVGVNVGSAKQTVGVSGVGSIKDTTTGTALYAGYQYNQTFGIEGGAAVLGEAAYGSGAMTLTVKPTTLYLAATATLPLNKDFNLFAKAGLTRTRTKSYAPGLGHHTDKDSAYVLGVGASFFIDKNFSAVIEYTDFGKLVKDSGADV